MKYLKKINESKDESKDEYVVDYTDRFIYKLNTVNEYEFRRYEKHNSYKDAKESLLNYWIDMKQDAEINIRNIKKMKEK